MLYTVEQYNKDSKPIELAPWRICIVTQVEEDKIVIRMLLIILIIIVTNTFLAQLQTFFCSPSLPSSTKKLGKIEFPTGPICVILLSSRHFFFLFMSSPWYPFLVNSSNIPKELINSKKLGLGLFSLQSRWEWQALLK